MRHGSAEELTRRVRESFVPLLRQMQGFRGYYLLNGGPDVLINIIMLRTRTRRLPPMTRQRTG